MRHTALLCLVVLASCSFEHGTASADSPDGGAGDGAIEHDGRPIDSAATEGIDAAPQTVTLRQAQSDVKGAQSDACNGPGVGQSRDETYARTFPLVAGFHVTAIAFLPTNANTVNGITVKAGTYVGPIGTATLDTAAITWLASASVDVPGSASSQLTAVPLALDVAAGGTLIVAVISPGYTGAQFNVASAAGSETEPSYFASQACGISQLAKTDPRNNSDVGTFILDVIGSP